MTEKNYVVNVKTKNNTIFTVRADSAEELAANITSVVNLSVNDHVLALEELFLGAPAPSAVDVVTQALGATVVGEQSFAPVPPPVTSAPPQTIAGSRTCSHGNMTARKGTGAKGEWKAFFCPAPNKSDQCTPVWLNRSMPEWNTI